ncbi:SCP-like protein [Ancylostoma caninum]|uniref:SCP-like protein n=1 Tax=Ancylostoma caninum TaxID=29170 RepID=A0A368H666_ANCCA|nr:SCP-like protein [Ancylostoma caninum]
MLTALIGTLALFYLNFISEFSCPSDLTMSDGQRSIFLDGHNDLRRKVAFGRYENREGYPAIGPAKNMYALSWDCELERKAQQSVASCSLEQGPGGEDGRNMMALSGSPSLSDDLYAQIAVLNWVSPVKFFGKNDPTNGYEERFCPFANVSGWRAMANADTTKVGCSIKRCGRDFFATCFYDKCHTVENPLIFEKGEACRTGDDCTTFPDSDCDNGLCIIH